ncbi:MAG: tetratricopeptide repeat protein [Pseudomonadota bacterium]
MLKPTDIVRIVILLSVASFAWVPPSLAATESAPPAQQTSQCNQGALNDLEKRAEGGEADAMYRLGTFHLWADCLLADRAKGKRWLRAAADLRHAQAAFEWGTQLYLKENNTTAAVPYLSIAAEQDHVQAQHHLGLILISSRGGTAQMNEGLAWVATAASNGSAFSALILGALHEEGLHGVPRWVCMALDWYQASHLMGQQEGLTHYHRLLDGEAKHCVENNENAKTDLQR